MRIGPFIISGIIAGFVFLTNPDTSYSQRLRMNGGNVTLTIGAPLAAGLDPEPAFDSRTRLRWNQLPFLQTKIIVSSQVISQSFELYVQATNIRGGFAAPEVQLTEGMLPQDFVIGISRLLRPNGSADLSYRAEAPAELGNSSANGNDVHTVIYTWTVQ